MFVKSQRGKECECADSGPYRRACGRQEETGMIEINSMAIIMTASVYIPAKTDSTLCEGSNAKFGLSILVAIV